MSANTSRLEDLVSLASETSSEKRRELLEGVTGMFLEAPEHFNDQEVDLFGEILGRVALEVEEQVRIRLSEQLSNVETAPKTLVLQLANDVIEVAAPQLLRSSVLKDLDLVNIVKAKGTDHQAAVAGREEVSEEVADALVETGAEQVLVAVAENAGVQLSRDAKKVLVSKSETIESLHKPLVNRGDIDADLKHEMYWWVSSALRDHIVSETGADDAVVEEMLRSSTTVMAERARHAANMSKAEREIQQASELGHLNQNLMVQLLRQGEREKFLYAFSYLTDLDIKTTMQILADPGMEAVAIACRAMNFDLSTFSAIVLLRNSESGNQRGGNEVASLLDAYMKLPEQSAKRAMRFWRLRHKTELNNVQAVSA